MILIIDNYDSFTYNLYQTVAPFHPQIKVVRNDKITINEIKALKPQGIILSPGPGKPDNAGICIDLVKTVLDIPLLGVCLGLQAIVVAFGGQVIPAPEIVHGKADLIFHQRKGLYQGLPLPFQAGRYHSLMAEQATLPPCLQVEAENPRGLIMGLSHIERPIFGLQFHPESILTPEGNMILGHFIQYCHSYKNLRS